MSTVMKALSIHQPWAWALANGHKPLENRNWPTQYRGELLIHATKTFDHEGLGWIRERFPELRKLLPDQFDLGGIVGLGQLVGCVQASASPWFVGRYGFVLHEARPLPFVPLRGQQGLFEVHITELLDAALKAGTPAQAEAEGQSRLFG